MVTIHERQAMGAGLVMTDRNMYFSGRGITSFPQAHTLAKGYPDCYHRVGARYCHKNQIKLQVFLIILN